jgi:hypothetical protein
MQNSNYYLQGNVSNNTSTKKIFFTGSEIIDEAYYIFDWGSILTLMVEIIPALERFKNINLILPQKSIKRQLLLEYAKLLNLTDINFIASENIREVRVLNLLPIEITYSTDSLLNLRWLLKYRGLITQKYNFKKIILINKTTDNDIPEEFLTVLQERKFSVIILETIPLQHLLSLLAGAEQVIITSKTGRIHTMYCSNNCKILDIINHDTDTKCMSNIIDLLLPKTRLFYEWIKVDEKHSFKEKFEQFFTT